MGALRIDILGTSFAIKSKEDSDYLTKLLGYYTRIAKDIERDGALKDPVQISILAGLTLCDELYKEKAQRIKIETAVQANAADIEADKITLRLIEKINTVLD
ncbi:MAG: cell division protein ZapA [Treponemataceae bacterium]|nr:cell division protein ZapA [Treponemataceae bacterium]